MEAREHFFKYAGWSYDPATETADEGRMRSAVELAAAEWWAHAAGVTFTWQDDWEIGSHKDYYGPGSPYEDGEPDSCESCLAEVAGLSVALGCIDGSDDNYRRVIEAELALELREQVMTELLTFA